MDKSLTDLLSDAFSETSVPSFSEDEELDFERLDFKDDGTILSHGNNNNTVVEQEDISHLLETASTSVYHNEQEFLDAKNNSQVCYSSSEEECEENEGETDETLGDFMLFHRSTQDNTGLNQNQYGSVSRRENILVTEENATILEAPSTDPFKDDQEKLWAKNIQDVEVRMRPEDCTSSEEESGEDEGKIEQKAGDFLETVHRSDDSEQVFAMGQDVGQKDRDQNSNSEGGEIDKKSYFESIRKNEGDLIMQNDSSEGEDQAESTKTMFFQVEYTLEYPEISYDGAEGLTDEVDKMEEFSGDEHQEAGESFAEYPSDFSSCEYVSDARNAQESDLESQLDCTAQNDSVAKSQKGIEEVETEDRLMNTQPMTDCTGENNTEGDCGLRSKYEMNLLEMTNQDSCFKLQENRDNDTLQSPAESSFSTWTEEDTKSSNADNTCINVACKVESKFVGEPMPYMNYEDVMCFMAEEEEVLTAVSSNRGSVDDSFFFSDEPEVSDPTEEGQMEDDEEEEKRREQERIQAFYRFYDDEDGSSNREERQTKVQFCVETLSQVIHYDTDSERESLSSSSDEGEKVSDQDPEQTFEGETCPSLSPDEVDLSSVQEPHDDKNWAQKDSSSPPEATNPESITKPISTRNHKCLSVLKLTLSLFLAVVMGLVMFWWWVTDGEEWLTFAP